MRYGNAVVTGITALFILLSVGRDAGAVSDWTGIYARVDKVILEPNANTPERIQIWGAFALASKQDRNSYEPAQTGYLYYSLKSGKEEVCRKEWADLKSVAGTGEILGFGSRDLPTGRLRKATDKPADADVYPIGFGVVRMNDRGTDYSPIRELRALPKAHK